MYNDDCIADGEMIEKMNVEYHKSEGLCEISELRQMAEVDEIFALLIKCETFFKWLENKDLDNSEFISKLLNETEKDKVEALSCGCRRGLDYRYACCDKDFNRNCCDYCKCEMEIIDKIIKILTLKNSIVDKQCMIKLLKSRMDILQLVFNKYACK